MTSLVFIASLCGVAHARVHTRTGLNTLIMQMHVKVASPGEVWPGQRELTKPDADQIDYVRMRQGSGASRTEAHQERKKEQT